MPQTDTKNFVGQELQQTAQTAPYPSHYIEHFEEGAIDLYELWITLWKRKWLVIGMTVVVALLSIVYALQLQRIYKSEALLHPPKGKNVQKINVHGIQKDLFQNTGIIIGTEVTAAEIFSKFKQNLKSRSILKKFIHQYGLMEILSTGRTSGTNDEDVYNDFAELIMLGNVNGATSLSIELHDAEIAAQWVNDLIRFVDKETITMLIEDFQNSIANHIMDIEYSIASKRLMAAQRREDQIIRYTEHAQIAKKLGMIGRVDATNIFQNTQMNTDVSTGIRRQSTATTPLYYLGYEALMTEIGILRKRSSDDPFINGLRDLQEQLTLLRSIKINEELMSAVYIDQAAYPPKSPIKPKRRVIVSVATVVGLFSGIFLALSIEFVNNQRKKHSE